MNRYIKIFFLVMISILDVAVLPFCPSSIKNNKGDLFVHAYYVEQTEDGEVTHWLFNRAKKSGYNDGDEVTQDDVIEIIDNFINKDKIKSFQVVKYYIENQGDGKRVEISLPYVLSDEVKIGYYQGIRGAYHIFVEVDVELVTQVGNEEA